MTRIDDIRLMQNEIDTMESFIPSIERELNSLHAAAANRKLTRKEEKRIAELSEIIADRRKKLNKYRREIRNFYKPAMVI